MSIKEKYPDLNNLEFVMNFDLAGCSTNTDPEGPVVDLHVAVALIRFDGNLSKASAALGRSRRVLETFIMRDIALSDLTAEIQENILDLVEEKVRELAVGGDPATARFYLSTKGKSRGYSTRVEQTGPNGGPMSVINSDMSPEQAAEAYAATLSNS